jgi:hypothetical protein
VNPSSARPHTGARRATQAAMIILEDVSRNQVREVVCRSRE